MTTSLLVLIIVLALVMAYINGFHDASNAVSTAITTRSLPESTALAMAAVLNVLGALLGLSILATTVGWAVELLGMAPLVQQTAAHPEVLGIGLIAIMLTTVGWDLLTWRLGMPSSTWHAFYAATAGASLAIGAAADWERLGAILVVSIVGPMLSAALAFLLMHLVLRLGRNERIRNGHLRFAQTISAGAVATGHGLNDSRLPMAVVVIATSTSGLPSGTAIAMTLPVALAVGAGTLMGGHRIIRTLGRRLTDLTAPQGLAAETSSATTMSLSILGLDSPVSTSHSLAASVVGAGIARGSRHVRWPVARNVALSWLATPLATAVTGAASAGVLLAITTA